MSTVHRGLAHCPTASRGRAEAGTQILTPGSEWGLPRCHCSFPKVGSGLGWAEGKLRKGQEEVGGSRKRAGAHLEGVLAAPSGDEDEKDASIKARWGWAFPP